MKRVLVLNGPNLDLLGSRQPEVYGRTTLADLVLMIKGWGSELGIEVDHFQSNHEGALIERIHGAAGSADGLVINPGAFGHYSRAIADALHSVSLPAVEVHISNIRRREPWRRNSVISPACVYSIYGRGLPGYRAALRHLVFRSAREFSTVSYGSFPDQVGDIRLPDGQGRVLVVLIHGGLWRDEWTRDTLDGLSVALTDAGYTTWNIEYRRVGSGGGWPESFDDIATAIARADEVISGARSATIVLGHSAGAAMGLWSAGQPTRPDVVVGLGALTDLVRAQREGADDGSIAHLLGRRHPEPIEYSPFHRLPNGIPLLLTSAKQDGLIPVGHVRDYVHAATRAGDEVEHLELDCGHFDLILPEGEPWQTILHRLRSRIPPL